MVWNEVGPGGFVLKNMSMISDEILCALRGCLGSRFRQNVLALSLVTTFSCCVVSPGSGVRAGIVVFACDSLLFGL